MDDIIDFLEEALSWLVFAVIVIVRLAVPVACAVAAVAAVILIGRGLSGILGGLLEVAGEVLGLLALFWIIRLIIRYDDFI